MKTSCPHCGQHYELDDSFAGQPVTCERCWKDFTVPAEKPSAAAVPEPKPKPAAEAPAPKTSKPVPAAPVPETTQRCPYCAGAVPAGVKKCRHCGEWIDREIVPRNQAAYILLALTLGVFAVHNFYSGARNKGFIKLMLPIGAITVLGIVSSLVSWIFRLGVRDYGYVLAPLMAGLISPGVGVSIALVVIIVWNIRDMIRCPEECSRMVADRKKPAIYIASALLAGAFGVHNFYSGATAKGLIKLALTFVVPPICGAIFARCGTPQSFPWFTIVWAVLMWGWVIWEAVHFRKELAESEI